MYKLTIFNPKTKFHYDVSSIANTIEHTTTLLGQPGKLTFILEKDPNNLLKLSVGNVVTFTVTEGNKVYPVFKGYIFTIGTDSTEAYKVTAYDQTRYLKNQDAMTVSGEDDGPMSVVDLFNKICDRNGVPAMNRDIKIMNCNYKLLPHLYQDSSYFDILQNSFQEHLTYSQEKQFFFVRDNFGKLQLNEVSLCKTNYIIGDYSNLTDYRYEVDIDKNTYNRIKVMTNSQDKGLSIAHIEQSEKSIAEFGVLQKLIRRDNMKPFQIEAFSKLDLKMSNKINRTISLDALGVPDLNAGDGFLFRLSKLGEKDTWMFILSATHHYDADLHTMSLDVSGFLNDVEIPKQTVEDIIYQIVRGELGNGKPRRDELARRGYSEPEINAIQARVNDLYDKAESYMKGEWGPVNYQNGRYYFGPQVEATLQSLGLDSEFFQLLLASDRFPEY